MESQLAWGTLMGICARAITRVMVAAIALGMLASCSKHPDQDLVGGYALTYHPDQKAYYVIYDESLVVIGWPVRGVRVSGVEIHGWCGGSDAARSLGAEARRGFFVINSATHEVTAGMSHDEYSRLIQGASGWKH